MFQNHHQRLQLDDVDSKSKDAHVITSDSVRRSYVLCTADDVWSCLSSLLLNVDNVVCVVIFNKSIFCLALLIVVLFYFQ